MITPESQEEQIKPDAWVDGYVINLVMKVLSITYGVIASILVEILLLLPLIRVNDPVLLKQGM
ncbi:hypothetical protein C1N53_02730 [Pontibacter sp. SGAir0037]|nr:hypothetical protein C1N53_02730 [Pontibacter sp. SGAir0037]